MAIGLVASAISGRAGADGAWTQGDHLAASDAAADDWFGYSVAFDGDTAIVGAWWDDGSAGTDQGSAYVFVRNGSSWDRQIRLSAADAAPHDWFGTSVAIKGDMVIVGAPLAAGAAGAGQGAAYVFVRRGSAWTQQARLAASDGAGSDFFGDRVALSGDTVIVGAQGCDGPAGADQGAAYIFIRSGSQWTQQTKLTASDASASDYFGFSVAIEGDTAIVGAVYGDGPESVDHGSAYVFVRSGTTWTQQARLIASDAGAADVFGVSVGLSGEAAIVGAQWNDGPAGIDQGSAYVFVRAGTTWTQEARLTASDAGESDFFGCSVGIDNGTAIVGAYHHDGQAGADQGSAYVFVRAGGTWVEQATLTASDAGAGDFFGNSVVVAGGTAVIGAAIDDGPAGINQGSAYVFSFVVNADLNGDGVVDSLDLGILLSQWSIPPKSPACSGRIPCPADLNGDGIINSLDLGILLSAWTL